MNPDALIINRYMNMLAAAQHEAITKSIELDQANARIAELEAAQADTTTPEEGA